MDARSALLEGLFDHAGMFPPAAKSFEDALRDAASFGSRLARPEMVGADMVLREDDLDRLTDDAMEAAGWPGDETCNVCLVGVPLERVEAVAHKVLAWNDQGTGARMPRRVVALEFTFDDDLQDGTGVAAIAVTQSRHLLRESEISLFVEPRWPEAAWTGGGLERVMRLLDTLAEDTDLPQVGLKVRCDGPTALGPDTLAAILPEVAARGLPFKATQGLHHAVVQESNGNRVSFLGLTAGLRLAQVRGLRGDELAACLSETDPGAFSFEGGVAWRDHHVALGDLGAAMQAVPFSIGSCSLTEPDEELQRL